MSELLIPEGYYRRLLSAMVLSCYLLSICQLPILEGLHYLSHCFSADHSHVAHSYHSHEDSHDHAGLDMIDMMDDTHQDSHKSITTADVDKKYQVDANYPLLIDCVEQTLKPSLYEASDYPWRLIDTYTPPPQV